MSRTDDRKRQRSDDFNSIHKTNRSRSRSRSRERSNRRNDSRSDTSNKDPMRYASRPTQPKAEKIPTTTTSTAHPKQQSMAAIVDAPLEHVAAQPPPQHIQYNIDETTLRKFCQPNNMEELVTMLRSTA
eukprot:148680_1